MRKFLFFTLFFYALTALGQSTARKFTVNLTSDGEANLTCFLPSAEKATGRAVIVCPGGAYMSLAMQHEGTDWSEYFNAQGIACFVLKYRLPKGDRNLPIGDAMKAIETVRDSATTWNVNPSDVGIMGASAGGHLASTVSTHADFAHRPNFSILFYPVISMDASKGHEVSSKCFLGEDLNNKTVIEEFCNERQVRRHITPPTIILLSNDDTVVPPVTNAIPYYSAMRDCGNDCAMHIYPTGGHGWGFLKSFAHHDEMLNNLTSWLKHL